MGSSRIWISIVSILVIVALTVFLYGYTYSPLLNKKHNSNEKEHQRDLVFGDYSKLFWGLFAGFTVLAILIIIIVMMTIGVRDYKLLQAIRTSTSSDSITAENVVRQTAELEAGGGGHDSSSLSTEGGSLDSLSSLSSDSLSSLSSNSLSSLSSDSLSSLSSLSMSSLSSDSLSSLSSLSMSSLSSDSLSSLSSLSMSSLSSLDAGGGHGGGSDLSESLASLSSDSLGSSDSVRLDSLSSLSTASGGRSASTLTSF